MKRIAGHAWLGFAAAGALAAALLVLATAAAAAPGAERKVTVTGTVRGDDDGQQYLHVQRFEVDPS